MAEYTKGCHEVADKHSMLSSIAVIAAAGVPVVLVTERAIARLAIVPSGVPAPLRALPWQTPQARSFLFRFFALVLPLILLLVFARFPASEAAVVAVVAAGLLTCCATDLLAYRVPDVVTLPVLGLGLIAAALSGHGELRDASLGMATCGGGLLIIALLTRGGLGGGDVKLAAMIGTALGLPESLFALAAGIVAGSLIVNVEPRPSPSLSALIAPPWISTR